MPPNDTPEALKWRSLHNYVYTQITLSLHSNFLASLSEPPQDTNRAHNLWSQIARLKKQSSAAHKLFHHQQLHEYKMREGTNIATHIKIMKQRRRDAEEVGLFLNDGKWIMVFLGSLPPSWETFVEKKADCTDADLVYSEAECRQMRLNTARSSGQSSSRCDIAMQTTYPARKYCSNCNMNNHDIKEC